VKLKKRLDTTEKKWPKKLLELKIWFSFPIPYRTPCTKSQFKI